ncbi:flavin reductase family protein [Corynebacterium vitaeruminis]|uniref:flavin reductase family protein n=1 Tax=Corynebacterium vitaeruminis TaxID=38305 RepID=UPI00046CEDE6|nr:flavin reductase family protein [Corynebacterium vitaeruminis]
MTAPTEASASVSAERLRETVGTFPSGVTIITTVDGGEDVGMTVSSFASLSLEPAMVSFSLALSSSKIKHFRVGSPVGISVLADHQAEYARQFSRKVADRFEGVDVWRNSEPRLITDAAAWFDGEIAAAYPGGDHTIFTVLVKECGTHDEAKPLLYQRGQMNNWSVEYSI